MPEPGPVLTAGLTLDRVTAGYGGGRPVLDRVSMTVLPSEVVGLIGPNGSGKTTLVRVASRGLRPSDGAATVAGHDPYALSARAVARLVAVVPQEMTPAFAFTVREVVTMGRAPHVSPWGGTSSLDEAIARRAMKLTDVERLQDRYLAELSGGERRRVVLAQALAQDAPTLLMDEPTTHLDLRHMVDLLTLVRRLASEEGKAVLAIFHDLSLAAATCDRLYALSGGRVVAAGTPEEVVTPDLLRTVFGVEAEVAVSPSTGRPAVTAVRPLPDHP